MIVDPWPTPESLPLDDEGLLKPPWIKYPNLLKPSLAWRLGVGETSRDEFRDWWKDQPRPTRLRTMAAYPEPPAWLGFCQSL